MKIAIPSQEANGLESRIYDHFGSAPYFAIYESEQGTIQFIPNSNADHVHGACSPMIALAGNHVDVVVVKGIGRNAISRLGMMGIDVYQSKGETLKAAVDAVLSGELQEFDIDTACEGHSATQ